VILHFAAKGVAMTIAVPALPVPLKSPAQVISDHIAIPPSPILMKKEEWEQRTKNKNEQVVKDEGRADQPGFRGLGSRRPESEVSRTEHTTRSFYTQIPVRDDFEAAASPGYSRAEPWEVTQGIHARLLYNLPSHTFPRSIVWDQASTRHGVRLYRPIAVFFIMG